MPNTLTSTQVARVVAGTDFPPAIPGVLNAVHVKFNPNGTSLSTSDVIQFVAVPNHARIIDIMLTAQSGVVDTYIADIGDGSLTARWASSISLSATTGVWMQKAQAGTGYLISLSASLESVGYDTIDVTMVTTSDCVTGSFQMSVYYLYEPASSR